MNHVLAQLLTHGRTGLRRHGPAALAGVACVLIFAFFAPLPKPAFSYRDDAVITLSHAKNFVELGSIGIDAAGARVEGFSAPLQFWVFCLVYALTHCSYERFLDVQVWVSTFALGYALAWLWRGRPVYAVMGPVAVAFWLTGCVRFFGWHHSGMENAYTHVLFVALLASCCRALERGMVSPLVAVCAWLASLSRLESIVHVAPVLVIWAWLFFSQQRSFAAARSCGHALLGWLFYQAFRYAYFGSLQPNTALAEGVDVLAALRGLLHGQLTRETETLAALRRIASEHRVLLALASLPLLALGRWSARRRALIGMLGSLALTALVHPLLFGPARLDPVRTTSHLALVAPLLFLTQWTELPRWYQRVGAALGMAGLLLLTRHLQPAADTFFCCPIKRADPIADATLAHAHKHGLARPSLANPDLGRISYRKDFLMFDLGMLGTPPLALLHGDHRHTADYLLDYAAPDFFELHGGWVCEYQYLLTDRRFLERYEVVPKGSRLGLGTSCRGRAGIWFRKDMARDSGSPERLLHDALRKKLDPARIALDLRSCERQPGRAACAYVVRTLYRFLPELERSPQRAHIVGLFAQSKLRPYATSLLQARERGDWYRAPVAFIRGD